MNVPYNEINLTDAAQRIGVSYSLVADWCKRKLINYIDLSEGNSRPRYMLIEKEVEHLKAERKKYGRGFISKYDKNWDMPEDDVFEYVREPEVEIVPQEEEIPTRKNSIWMISRPLYHTCRISTIDLLRLN